MGGNGTSNEFRKYGSASLIIWPIIGNPAMLTLSSHSIRLKRSFSAELWVLGNVSTTIETLEKELKGHLNVYPLTGLDRHRQANRAHMLPITISSIIKEDLTRPEDPTNLTYYHKLSKEDRSKGLGTEPPRILLNEMQVFPDHPQCFRCSVEIALSKDTTDYLKDHTFILYDIIQTFENHPDETRILPHAICLHRRKKWEDFTFIQLSDLHISNRNDEILGVVTKNMRTSVTKSVVKVINKTKKLFTGSDKSDSKDNRPLEERIINPNNYFRRFCHFANQQALEGKLDFIAITGDCVDFCIRADKITKAYNYNYSASNWVRFLDIVINRPPKPKDGYDLLGIEPSEELLVPFFTVPGNHDYRIGHYSIQSLGIYKHLGMKWHEAVNYSERTPLAPLQTSIKSLLAYFQHINPYKDYYLKLGPHIFLFMDSGGDSMLELKSLLMAEPALTGFSDSQMEFQYRVCDEFPKEREGGKTFFFSHAPIINPVLKKSVRKKIKGMFGIELHEEPKNFKESGLKQLGLPSTRSDTDLEYRAGTISENWVETVGLIQRVKGYALNGHTHKWREFRTERADSPSISHTGLGKKVLNPFAIYWDDYTTEHGDSNPRFFEDHAPFHFQTPALGIDDVHSGLTAGAYRLIKIKNNHIWAIKLLFLDPPKKE